MRRIILTIFTIAALLIPTSAFAQSGDATWLETMDGLETAIGRSWTAPLTIEEVMTETVFNEEGTPVSEISMQSAPASTPVVTDAMQTQMLSALIYKYDTEANAETGIELFYEAQKQQISRDSRNPATTEFTPELDANIAYGNEGTYAAIDFEGESGEMAVVYVLAQEGNFIYQVFGVFLPGNHIELATDITRMMMEAEVGTSEPEYDMGGESTGGLWEKLNAIEIAMPDETYIADLEIYPPADDAVMGDSVAVPLVELNNLASVPGIVGSWHITYAPAGDDVLVSTPNVLPDGVFNIELWVMEFEDPTLATAAAISLNATLTEPLGIVSTEGGGFTSDDRQGITMVNSGFVRDRSIPEGDAAVVVAAEGSTLYAARVYSNGPAPTPLAQDLIDHLISGKIGAGEEVVDGMNFSGGVWEVFPVTGNEILHDLQPVIVRHDDPALQPVSTPVG